MKQPIKTKTMTPVAVAFPLQHYISINKKYRKYMRYIFLSVHGLPMPLNRWTNPRHYLKRFTPRITTGNSTTWQHYISTIPSNS